MKPETDNMHTHTTKDSLKRPIKQTVVFLDCVSNPEKKPCKSPILSVNNFYITQITLSYKVYRNLTVKNQQIEIIWSFQEALGTETKSASSALAMLDLTLDMRRALLAEFIPAVKNTGCHMLETSTLTLFLKYLGIVHIEMLAARVHGAKQLKAWSSLLHFSVDFS